MPVMCLRWNSSHAKRPSQCGVMRILYCWLHSYATKYTTWFLFLPCCFTVSFCCFQLVAFAHWICAFGLSPPGIRFSHCTPRGRRLRLEKTCKDIPYFNLESTVRNTLASKCLTKQVEVVLTVHMSMPQADFSLSGPLASRKPSA